MSRWIASISFGSTGIPRLSSIRKDVARIKDAYEAAWMPSLQALAQDGALQAEPAVARLLIFGALNWAVSWYSPRKGRSLDALTGQAMDLFVRKD